MTEIRAYSYSVLPCLYSPWTDSCTEGVLSGLTKAVTLFICAGHPSNFRCQVSRPQEILTVGCSPPNFDHNSLASSMKMTVLNFLYICAIVCYLDQAPAALWKIELILWRTITKLQRLTTNNPPPPVVPVPEEVHRSRRSRRSGNFHQKDGESLKDYIKHFNQAVLEVEDVSDKSKADKYIAIEELAEAKYRRRGRDDHKRNELDSRRADYKDELGSPERKYGDNRPTTGDIQVIHGSCDVMSSKVLTAIPTIAFPTEFFTINAIILVFADAPLLLAPVIKSKQMDLLLGDAKAAGFVSPVLPMSPSRHSPYKWEDSDVLLASLNELAMSVTSSIGDVEYLTYLRDPSL
ncbi:hypothetical protein Acr_26g0008410 [Actinidia rufa]|uniref:Uncharacterized protein n=1 Tax=Actinidia rufa TaxID=165716 RepID=A0A7J0H3J9_9ERIC|nr:hypothetical protein Acr_26g0008410 [Actinidia rufa]